MNATLKSAADAAPDPLLQFLAADVPTRYLLEHGAEALDWLAAVEESPIWMTYPDGAGGMILEEVSKVGLLERSHKLGWTVASDRCGSLEFEEAINWQDDAEGAERVPGVWFAHTDCVEWEALNCGVPLTITAARLQQLRDEWTAFQEQARQGREKSAAEAQARREEDARQGHEILVESRIALHRRKGVEITREQAEREIEDIVAGFRGIRELAADLAEHPANAGWNLRS